MIAELEKLITKIEDHRTVYLCLEDNVLYATEQVHGEFCCEIVKNRLVEITFEKYRVTLSTDYSKWFWTSSGLESAILYTMHPTYDKSQDDNDVVLNAIHRNTKLMADCVRIKYLQELIAKLKETESPYPY